MKRTTLLVIAFVLIACSSFNLTNFFSLKSDKATATVGDNSAELTLGEDAYKKLMAVPHEITSAQAKPDEETMLELSDGASVVVPAGSASKEVKIILERNPDKAKNMPALGEYMVPISSFYNIETAGEGLVGPVEIHLPVDKSLIPEGMTGSLVALYPDGKGGWRSEPVEEINGKVVLYTDNLSDPLNAWYFHPLKKIPTENLPPTREEILNDRCRRLSGIVDAECKTKELQNLWDAAKRNTPLCDPKLALQVTSGDGRLGAQVEVFGRVVSSFALAGSGIPDDPGKVYQNLPVEIKVNYKDVRETPKTINVNTDSEEKFQLTLDSSGPDSGLKEGWNWIFANSKCPGGNGFPESESRGYAEFKLLPKETENGEPTPTVGPVQPAAGTVVLPDVTGLSLEDGMA